MVDDVNLDSFLNVSNNESSPASGDGMQAMPRPKLKKIKRPKIRPQPDIPPAPAKMSADGEDDLSSLASELAQDEVASDVMSSDDSNVSPMGTELMTSVEAQNISREESLQSSYALGNFSQDFDFDDDIPAEFDDGSYIKKNIVYSVATACLVIGIVLGFLIAPKGTEQHGLEDVAWNVDTPKGRVRCGKTDPSQACTFYVLNSFKRELSGRDFYKLAAQMTGREEFMIETENMQYATTKIKPGFFAQLNIPALK